MPPVELALMLASPQQLVNIIIVESLTSEAVVGVVSSNVWSILLLIDVDEENDGDVGADDDKSHPKPDDSIVVRAIFHLIFQFK